MIDSLDQNINWCLSGGAQGSDLQWGMCAGSAGHQVIHWSFDGHVVLAPLNEIVQLTSQQLSAADSSIVMAASKLSKHPPSRSWIRKLIQRNYYQVNWAQSVYAVTKIENNIPQGGTAWAIAMYLNREGSHACYVYDQTKSSWYAWSDVSNTWVSIVEPPPPQGVWAGIGTRDLHINGKIAIRNLMNYQPTAIS